MPHHTILRALALLALTGTGAAAQTPARPPVRQLPAPSATSADVLGSLAGIRHLPDGNVLVNDQAGRRVLLAERRRQANLEAVQAPAFD